MLLSDLWPDPAATMKAMKVDITLVKSFTKDIEAGNPAGIVLDAAPLSDEQMQQIARDLGFAESAFVLPSGRADFRLRFFAPNHEVDLCGHGTIATFHGLGEAGIIEYADQESRALKQETRAGLLDVVCHRNGLIVMSQTDPQFGSIEQDRGRIAALLGIDAEHIVSEFPMQIVSTGTPKLLIPLGDMAALRAVQPDLEGIKAYCLETGARGFYPFTTESPILETDFFARQFNPLADPNEDPITGVAAGALGCYAAHYGLYDKRQFTVAQGHDLDQGGTMFVDVTHGTKVGGYAVTYGHQELEV